MLLALSLLLAALQIIAPGDGVYVHVPSPGDYQVAVVDASTGVVVLSKSFRADAPGVYLVWRTSESTAEGTYKVYVRSGDWADVYVVEVRRPWGVPWWVFNAAVVLSAAAGVAAYVLRTRHINDHVSAVFTLPSGASVEVSSERAVFGREVFAKLGVPKELLQYISRVHFAVYRKGGRFYIEDLGSKNGTFLNGRPIAGLKPQPLKSGDVVTVANVLTLRFREGRGRA